MMVPINDDEISRVSVEALRRRPEPKTMHIIGVAVDWYLADNRRAAWLLMDPCPPAPAPPPIEPSRWVKGLAAIKQLCHRTQK